MRHLLLFLAVAQGWQVVAGMTVKSQSWECMIEGPPPPSLRCLCRSRRADRKASHSIARAPVEGSASRAPRLSASGCPLSTLA